MEKENDQISSAGGGDLASLVVERITREGVRPLPWWRFAIADVAFWGTWIGATALGGAAAAVTFYDVTSLRWDLYEATHDNFWTFVTDSAPWVWLASLLVFVPVGVLAMRATRRGYRRKVSIALGLSALTSLLAGVALYSTGVGRAIDSLLPEGGRIIYSASGFDRRLWSQPDLGRIAGQVVSTATGSIVVESWDGAVWQVHVASVRPRDLRLSVVGAEVRVLGIPATTTGAIQACLVLPWGRTALDAPRRGEEEAAEKLASDACRAMPWYEKISGRQLVRPNVAPKEN